jgi:glutamate racemase
MRPFGTFAIQGAAPYFVMPPHSTSRDTHYNSHVKIGVFDSGVGGLCVLRELRTALPNEDLIYVADSRFVPYGSKPPDVILGRSSAIVEFLVKRRSASAVVVACNTATTHAVDGLRRQFASLPIVGMEPAIKPAARATRTRVVGILATGATLAGERVVNLIERNADGIEVITQPCPGLVEQVELGDLSGPRTLELLERYTTPLLERGADSIVLGCTHYNFLQDTLRQVVGPSIALFDSAAAVARQTVRVLAARPAGASETVRAANVEFLTTGEPRLVRPVIEQLWGEPATGLGQLSV